MRSNILLVGFISLAIIFVACNEQLPPKETTASQGAALCNYLNRTENISISYPCNWDTTKLNPAFILMARDTSSSSGFPSDLTLYKIKLTTETSIESALDVAEKDLKKKFGISSLVYSGSAVNEHNLQFGLLKAELEFEKQSIYSYGVYFLRHKEMFVLNLSVLKKEDTLCQPKFDDVINSFEFRN